MSDTPTSATVSRGSDSSQLLNDDFFGPQPVDFKEWIEVMMKVNNDMSEEKKRGFRRFVMSHSQTHFKDVTENLTRIPKLEESLKECLKDSWKYISTPKNRLILQPYLGLCAIYQIALSIINSYDTLPSSVYEEDLFKHICRTLCAFIPYNTGAREVILNIGLIRYYIKNGNLNQLNDDFFSFPLLPEKYSFKNFMQLIVDTAEKQEAEKKSPQMPDDLDSDVEGGKLRRRRQYRRRRSIKKSKSMSKSRSRSRSRSRKVRKTRRYRK
jgi:hypothetical protein